MTPFHVGMKVVCIRDDWRNEPDYWINKGEVLEIAEMEAGPILSGLRLSFTVTWNHWFCSSCFRPVHENRMDELRSLLVPNPSKAKTKVQA